MAYGRTQLAIKDQAGTSRNLDVLSSDGTVAGNLSNTSLLVDANGAAIDFTSTSPIKGSTANDAALTDAPVAVGGRAATSQPTAVSADGDAVYTRHDKTGRPVVALHQARELRDSVVATRTASTSLGDLVAAEGTSGIHRDLLSITLNNSSATDTVVEIYDADDTTLRWSGTAKANDMRGITFPVPLKSASANTKWRWKTLTSVSSVTATVQFTKES